MNSIIPISILIAIGMTCLLWLLYKWLRENLSKNGFKEENEKNLFFFFCGVVCFFISYLWFVPQFVIGDVINSVVTQQNANCTATDDTSIDQCRYFQNVLNGKYSNNEPYLDIQHYIAK